MTSVEKQVEGKWINSTIKKTQKLMIHITLVLGHLRIWQNIH